MRTLFPLLLFFLGTAHLSFAFGAEPALSPESRKAEITMEFKLAAPPEAKSVRLWIPYPESDENQRIGDIRLSGNFASSGVYPDNMNRNTALYAEWKGPSASRELTLRFVLTRRECRTGGQDEGETSFSAREFARYLNPRELEADSSLAREYARKITEGKTTHREKARAIYDWIVENMYRDPEVKGCGLGEVDYLLKRLGGKCTDMSSVFVALCRRAGVPARETFGIRIPKGTSGDMTKAQHCWAEFYQPGTGWIVVDPADVRKAILEQKLDFSTAAPFRAYYFGTVDANRLALGTGRDLSLNPRQDGPPLNFFMYPYAEADGRVLNEDIFGFNLGYRISFQEKD